MNVGYFIGFMVGIVIILSGLNRDWIETSLIPTAIPLRTCLGIYTKSNITEIPKHMFQIFFNYDYELNYSIISKMILLFIYQSNIIAPIVHRFLYKLYQSSNPSG